MKNARSSATPFVVAVSMLALGVAAGAGVSAESRASEQIEYRSFSLPEIEERFGRSSPSKQLDEWLNKLGREGWHLPELEIFQRDGKLVVQPIGSRVVVWDVVAWRVR